MVSIIPSARSPWDVIGSQIGANVSQNLPGAIEKGYERGLGLSALEKAERALKEGITEEGINRPLNPYEIAMQFAKVGANNPALERALGPLMQTAMQEATVNRAFPQGAGSNQQLPAIQGQAPKDQSQQGLEEPFKGALAVGQQSGFATPSPFNIMTPEEIVQEGQRYAQAVRNPNAAAMREQQLRNQNESATQQRKDLEDAALKTQEVTPAELPRFMQVGKKFDPRNPSEWLQNTQREYAKVKANDKKIQTQFIPGIGQALMGQNRQEALKRLQPVSQEQKKLGLEEDTRKYYQDQYMSPVEIEEQFRPLTPMKEKEIKKLPMGLFPHESEITFERGFPENKKSMISYEEALEKAPKELEIMQNQLADFFLKNVDDDTSLSVLSNKIWQDKDYDWRQLGPAIREAQNKGLKLTDRQSTELADIESNPPMQSLPDIFRDLSRIPSYLRGNK